MPNNVTGTGYTVLNKITKTSIFLDLIYWWEIEMMYKINLLDNTHEKDKSIEKENVKCIAN